MLGRGPSYVPLTTPAESELPVSPNRSAAVHHARTCGSRRTSGPLEFRCAKLRAYCEEWIPKCF